MAVSRRCAAAVKPISTRRMALFGGALMAALPLLPMTGFAAEPTSGLADLLAPILPSVVSIYTIINTSTGQLSFFGSGFIIRSTGLVATNRHVAAGATELSVTVPGHGQFPAKPVYVAEYIDFALLQIEGSQPLPAVTLGDSDAMRVGDTVLVVGNPLAVGQSLSVGVISALDRDIGDGRFDRFFQTDAAINHGNSGGPMVNLKGQVIAINSALYSSPGNTGSIGIGFAMPIDDVKFVIDQYLHGGKVVIGSTGVRAQRMTPELAAAFGATVVDGSIVTEVLPGGSAIGKLRPGDLLIKVGEQDASDTAALARLVVSSTPGTIMPVTYLRGGQQNTTMITVGREEIDPLSGMIQSGVAPSDARRFMTPTDLGFEVTAIGPAERRQFFLADNAQGLVVTQVDPRSVASKGMEVGDVVLSLDDGPIGPPSEIPERVRALSNNHRKYAAFLLSGERGTRWAAFPLQSN